MTSRIYITKTDLVTNRRLTIWACCIFDLIIIINELID